MPTRLILAWAASFHVSHSFKIDLSKPHSSFYILAVEMKHETKKTIARYVSIFAAVFIGLYAHNLFSIPDKLLAKKIQEYEAPLLGVKDFDALKNINPELPEGSIALAINDGSIYTAVMHEQSVTLKQSYASSILHEAGAEVSSVYKGRGNVTHHYETFLFAKTMDSEEQCLQTIEERARRLETVLNDGFFTKGHFIKTSSASLSFKADGYFEKQYSRMGYRCVDKTLYFIFAKKEGI